MLFSTVIYKSANTQRRYYCLGEKLRLSNVNFASMNLNWAKVEDSPNTRHQGWSCSSLPQSLA